MSRRATPSPPGGRRGQRWLVVRLIDRWDDRITAPIDARAREHGWTTRRLPGTRTVEYRNPMFDLRVPCELCAATGLSGAAPCDACEGNGVVTLQPVDILEETS